MATTTASITLSSSDLLTDNLSLSATMNLYQNGTTATGLDEMNYHRLVIPTGTQFDLIAESAALSEDASYVYIINKNTDVTDYVCFIPQWRNFTNCWRLIINNINK